MSFKLESSSKLLSKEFTFGVATASFQIEGAIDADGRCESIWDRFCSEEGNVLNMDNGAVACDHYARWESDLDLLVELGVEAYRFSVAWPRLEPKPGQWNEKGFDFYENIIDGLIKRNIKPYITLYHWDLPQYLEDNGGWVNRETSYRFARMAEKVCQRFGNKVHSYITLNEPWCAAYLGYRLGIHAPGHADDRLGFQALHHLLLAHGLAIPLMRKHAPESQHGLVLNFTPVYPATNDKNDIEAATFSEEENADMFLQPVINGGYPQKIFERHPQWRPTIIPGDAEIIASDIDFLGVNYYSRSVVKASSEKDYEGVEQNAPKTDIGWEIYPDGLADLLVSIQKKYPIVPPMIVTENGAADNTEITNGIVADTMRVDYYNTHLQAVDRAIEKGVHITGYFAWSLMDNFEWAEGYSQRFGIVHVNYETQQRTIKNSGLAFKEFLKRKNS